MFKRGDEVTVICAEFETEQKFLGKVGVILNNDAPENPDLYLVDFPNGQPIGTSNRASLWDWQLELI